MHCHVRIWIPQRYGTDAQKVEEEQKAMEKFLERKSLQLGDVGNNRLLWSELDDHETI